MTDRKRPGVAFWATVVVVCLLLYPLSYGPAVWMTVNAPQPVQEVIVSALQIFYLPLGLVCDRNETLTEIMNRYSDLWL
jgi:hypothetical protein